MAGGIVVAASLAGCTNDDSDPDEAGEEGGDDDVEADANGVGDEEAGDDTEDGGDEPAGDEEAGDDEPTDEDEDAGPADDGDSGDDGPADEDGDDGGGGGGGDGGDDDPGDDDDEDPGSVRLVLGSEQATVGEQATVDVDLLPVDEQTPSIGGVDVEFTHEGDLLSFESATSDDFQVTGNDQNGTVVAIGTVAEGVDLPVEAAITFAFSTEAAGETALSIRRGESSVIDVAGDELDTVYEDGTLTVSE